MSDPRETIANTAASSTMAAVLPTAPAPSVLGIDLGSRRVKICLMNDGTVVRTDSYDSMTFYRTVGVSSEEGFTIDLGSLGLDAIDRIIATGYGRYAASFTGADVISELTAHFLGAQWQTGRDDFTLLDMGGQDYKIMRISAGRIVDMATNDKCAASTGRYLENMAVVLGLTIDELGTYTDDPVALSSTCAVFGESELVGLIVKGESTGRLAAGVNRAAVERVLPILHRMGGGAIVMSGGVALNRAVAHFVAVETGRDVVVVADPVHNGAIGCCIRAMRETMRDSGGTPDVG